MRTNKIQIIRWLSLLPVLVLLTILSPVPSKAAKSGVEISPVTYEFEIKEGESQTGSLNVRNLDATPLEYVIETELFSKVSEDGAPAFDGTEKPEGITSLTDWITFSTPMSGTLAPSGQTDVNFTISVPVGAEPGGHYAAIFAKQIKKDAQGKTQLGVNSRLGLIILVSVPGDVVKGTEIKAFEYPAFITKGPSQFSMRVENTGSVHYDAVSKVELKPLLGKTQTVDLGKHAILPHNIRAFSGEWKNKYPFGYYKISASTTDGKGELVTVTGSLWALPVNIVIPILILVLILWLIIIYAKGHFQVVRKDDKQ